MDVILETVKLEITLDCAQGSSLDRVWSFVEKAQRTLAEDNGVPVDDISVSDQMKMYLWPYIVSMDGLTFMNSQAEPIFDPADEEKCKEFQALSLAQVDSQFAGMAIRASDAAINREMYGRSEGNQKVMRSANAVKILEAVSRAREKGMTQIGLSKQLGLDPRSSFHYIKVLESEGMVAKYTAYDDGLNTNLIILRRYVAIHEEILTNLPAAMGTGKRLLKETKIKNQITIVDGALVKKRVPGSGYERTSKEVMSNLVRFKLRERISKILEERENGSMVEMDLLEAVGLDFYDMGHRKYFHRVIGFMSDLGCLERVRMRVQSDLLDEEIENDEYEIPDENLPRVPTSMSMHWDIPTTDGGTVRQKKTKEAIDAEIAERKSIREKKIQRGVMIRQKSARRRVLELRRCVRFIKPYVDKRKVRASLGVPLNKSRKQDKADSAAMSADESSSQDEETVEDDEDAALADMQGSDDNDEDDDAISSIEAVKEHADIKHLLSMPQVRMGTLSGLSLESQVFRLVALSGSKGTVAKAVQFILRLPRYKILIRVFERLLKSSIVLENGSLPGTYAGDSSANGSTQIPKTEMLITCVDEFLGREHRKRYFANPAAVSLMSPLLVDLGTEETGAVPKPLTASSSASTADKGKHKGNDKGREVDVEAAPGGQVTMPPGNTESQEADGEQPAAPEHSGLNVPMAEILKIAETQSKTVNAVIRQECLMLILKEKGIINVNSTEIERCQNRARIYMREREAAGDVTAAVATAMIDHKMDKRTFLRIIHVLASEKRLHHRAVVTDTSRNRNVPQLSHLAISEDIDPNGDRVDAFIEVLKEDMLISNSGTKLRLPPLVENAAPVPRTMGSKERDRRYIDSIMGMAKFRGTVAIGRRKRYRRLAAEVDSGAAYSGNDLGEDEPLYKRAKRENIQAGRTHKDPAWEEAKQEMVYLRGTMIRLQILHQFLISDLARSVDNIRVFPNYIFSLTYLLYALPLRLHIQLCNGSWYTHAANRYVRYGTVRPELDDPDIFEDTEEQRKAQQAAADEEELVQSTPEEMTTRLNTPISKLPKDLITMIMSRVSRARGMVQQMLYQMYILQLLQPILNEPGLTGGKKPADAKDVFKDPPLLSKNQSPVGYQLIGSARILDRKGYMSAVEFDKFSGTAVSQDLSANYVNSNVYNVFVASENLQYWDDLQVTARNEGSEITVSHPLFRINSLVSWRKQSRLNRIQIATLNTFINSAEGRVPPMEDVRVLKAAAREARVSLPDARMFFRKIEAKFLRNDHIRRRKHFEENLKKDASTVAAREMNKINLAKGTAPPTYTSSVARPQAILPAPRPPRRNWSAEEQHLLTLTFVVVKHYCHRHNIPTLLMPALKVFPDRYDAHRRTERLRHQWGNLMRRDHFRSLNDCLTSLWPHVYEDAVKNGELEDSNDREKWDIVKEVYYLQDLLEKKTLMQVLEDYKEKLYYDYVDVAEDQQPDLYEYLQNMARTGASKLAELARKAQEDREANEEQLSDRLKKMLKQKHTKDKEKIKIVKGHTKYLPETIEEFKQRYLIVSKEGRPTIMERGFKPEFPEDNFRRGSTLQASFQQFRVAKNTMYTVRQGWSCLADESNPVSTQLQLPSDDAPVIVPVCTATPKLVYTDMMQSLYPVVRILNSQVLRRAFNQLVSNPVLVVDDTAIDEIGKLCTDRYVSSSRLRAIITNLVLTPNEQYDEVLANKLLVPDKYVTELILKYIQRTLTITRLASNAMSIGLAKLVVNNVLDPTTFAPYVPDDAPAETDFGSTIVVHETSGSTRVSATEAQLGTHATGTPDDDQLDLSSIERRTPGRGFAITEKFANVLNGNLPASFLNGTRRLPELSTTDHIWESADTASSLALFAEGRLWLRPVYSAKPDAPFGPMSGFQRRLNIHVIDFDLRISTTDAPAVMDTEGNQDSDDLGLAPEVLEKALSALAMLIHETGAMGVTLGELHSLIGQMIEKTPMGMPEMLQTVLQSRPALQILIDRLVASKRLFVVGCTDQRYVSDKYYRAQWMTKVDDPPLTLVPYLGQSLNGSANKAFLLNLVRSVIGQILEHPGISQTNLMRRFFAPHVAKAEVQRFLEILCKRKIIDRRVSEVPVGSDTYITTYRSRPDYYSKLRQLSWSFGDLLPLDS